jgi:hypothetical protein
MSFAIHGKENLSMMTQGITQRGGSCFLGTNTKKMDGKVLRHLLHLIMITKTKVQKIISAFLVYRIHYH